MTRGLRWIVIAFGVAVLGSPANAQRAGRVALVLDYLPEPPPTVHIIFIDRDIPGTQFRSFEHIVNLDVDANCSVAETWRAQPVTVIEDTTAPGKFRVVSKTSSCRILDAEVLPLSRFPVFINLLDPRIRARLRQTLTELKQMPELDERARQAFDHISQHLLQ